ncbi:hypothetical protein ACOSQ3_023450 [Xanthoceras sorbifolium]
MKRRGKGNETARGERVRVKLELCLVGKLCMNRMVNREAFRMIIPRIWKLRQAVDIEVIGANIFMFSFACPMDRRRALAGGRPWCLDHGLLVLEEPTGKGELTKMRFDRVMFWIQIHNTPLLCMNKETCSFHGSLIGEVVEVDSSMAGECFGKYLQVRVWVDLTKALKRFLRVAMAADEPETILLLKYERLPDFCTHCGLVGHVLHDCLLTPVGGFKGEEDRKFCAWLRATSPLKSRMGRGAACTIAPLTSLSSVEAAVEVGKGRQKLAHGLLLHGGSEHLSDKCDAQEGKQNHSGPSIAHGNSGRPYFMRTLFWNVRGLGSDRTVHVLHKYLQDINSDVVFLSETIADADRMEVLIVRLGFLGSILGLSSGGSGVYLLSHGFVAVTLTRSSLTLKKWEEGSNLIQERLDRCLCDLSWHCLFACGVAVSILRHVGRISMCVRILSSLRGLIRGQTGLVFCRILRVVPRILGMRSRVAWLRSGDRNTKFFHSRASTRRATNKIAELFDRSGVWCNSRCDIEHIIVDYFSRIFQKSNSGIVDCQGVLDCVECGLVRFSLLFLILRSLQMI